MLQNVAHHVGHDKGSDSSLFLKFHGHKQLSDNVHIIACGFISKKDSFQPFLALISVVLRKDCISRLPGLGVRDLNEITRYTTGTPVYVTGIQPVHDRSLYLSIRKRK